MTDYLLVVVGAALLYGGGELLVRSASSLARTFGLSSFVIGLTVVAFGTSSPELAATLASSLRGTPEVAIGNVVGSNIANIGLILGGAALVFALQSVREVVRREVPLLSLCALLLFPLLLDGWISRLEGALLLGLLGLYLGYQFRKPTGGGEEGDAPQLPLWRALLGVALGTLLLVVGAQALVGGAVSLAEGFGVPERVIGLTLVALGTSLPELASSLVAALRRQGDLILGNVIGSNIFNVLTILGVTALVRPLPVSFEGVSADLWVLVGFSMLVLPLMGRRHRLGHAGGGLLLTLYLGYVGALFLR